MLTMVDSVLTTRGKKKLGGERNALIVEICALLVEDDRASALALSCALADFGIVFHLANSLSGARRCLLDLSHHIDAVLLVPALSDGRAEDLLPEIEALPRQPGVIILGDYLEEIRPEATSYRAVWAKKTMDPSALASLIRRAADGYAQNTLVRFARRFGLTSKETKVLDRVVAGMGPKQIAVDFGCSIQSIYAYLAKVNAKTECSSYQEVVARLFQFACHGLGHTTQGVDGPILNTPKGRAAARPLSAK